MRQLSCLLFFSFVACVFAFGQSRNLQVLNEVRQVSFETVALHQPFTFIDQSRRSLAEVKLPRGSILMGIEASQLPKDQQESLRIAIPQSRESEIILNLKQSEVFTEDFQLFLSSARTQAVAFDKPQTYWGQVAGYPNSSAAITIGPASVEGVITYDNQVLTLGKTELSQGYHALYNEITALDQPVPFECKVTESHVRTPEPDHHRSAADENNCVQMYLEIANDIYVDKGGAAATTAYITGVFNEVIALYAAENINFSIREMVLWDQPDPYENSSDPLRTFMSELDGQYNGDLAHLISYGSGGVAYIGSLCDKLFGIGYSGIYSSFAEVPTYSWSVEVITHEIGHNLGARHTHDCAWNGNNTQIDDCGSEAGYVKSCYDPNSPILPENGGTIMSYCHLLSSVRINFQNGFHQQPGDLIRSNVYNESCLTSCSGGQPLTIAIDQKADVSCGGTSDGSATALASGGSGTYNYSWSNGQTGAAAINLGPGTYAVTVSDGIAEASTSVEIVDNNNTYYADNDGDDYGVSANTIRACNQPADYASLDGDCDDTNNQIYPGAPEGCDGIDSNCDGEIATSITYYQDADGDGFGNPNVSLEDCTPPSGYVENNTDCDDTNSSIYPGAPEGCDGIDSNCDGEIATSTTYYQDADGDGFGNPNASVEDCTPPNGYVEDNTDCDDTSSSIYPGAPCDDNDVCTINDIWQSDCTCAGLYVDSDGDGVCDNMDICPGGDDNIDTDGDGIPDYCDSECTDQVVTQAQDLSVLAAQSSSVTSNFSGETSDVHFTISNLGTHNGYIERITVSATDPEGVTTVQVFQADVDGSTVAVTVPGIVSSVTVTLDNASSARPRGRMKVDLSAFTACVVQASRAGTLDADNGISVSGLWEAFPNPVKDRLYLKFSEPLESGTIHLLDPVGRLVIQENLAGLKQQSISLVNVPPGVYYLRVVPDGVEPSVKQIIVID